MKSGSWSSLVAAQEPGFFGYPDDLDDYQSEVKPPETVEQIQRELAAVCGADNDTLLVLGYSFDLCDREPGHPGFCWFRAL